MSEPTPIDLPVGLRWVKLVCRLGRLVTDSAADVDAHPDLLPVGGTLTLTASPSRVRIQEADGRWRSVEVAGRTYTIRADGELVDNEGRVGVYIPDPASLLVEPQGYAITAAVKPTAGTEWRVTVGGSTVLPDVVDLVAVSSVGSVSPSVTASFDARLYALEQGGGVDVSQAVEDYLTANPPAGSGGSGVTATDTPAAPAEGQSASYLVTSAVTWPAGLVWSDDPDGGTAPTITGTALVSLFTVGGTTRAIMGATFPSGSEPDPDPDPDPTDTTPPTVGTMTASEITTSGFTLTVSGASDGVGLHAQPYAFTTDGGATWSAYQTSPVYVVAGKTAGTGYSCNWRVRDAAGNVSTGTAQTVTTGSVVTTLVSDDFNRADNATTLGTATTGQTWTNDLGVIGIVSNQAKRISGVSRSLIEVGQRDMYVSVLTAGGASGGHAVYARWADANNYYTVDVGASGTMPKLIAKMAGADINVRATKSMVVGDRYGIRVKDRTGGGAVVELLVNDVVLDTWDHADSTIVGTKAGIFLNTSALMVDNFTVTSA